MGQILSAVYWVVEWLVGSGGDGVGSTPGYLTSLILYISVVKWLPGIRTHHLIILSPNRSY